ncbi:5-oxopent-3-ene-1,2,5-tricarboxylate decarboxylase [Caballeronia temeraria]|uniref:5-oxopent-3-ene-1,2,5-tricarboxylate decarboxylase n=1 Tax=Caballeronia temeraria TaxID=1777137 RepID=A0A158DXX0_9BURK|nr:fumarylacetoacetate hydrolase family protein [Caballeronia temeraria]SAK99036.1 5-oxopent-3-ene-1,2,5-tricarboxylate decarboxylase [Caballeronia temeraria]
MKIVRFEQAAHQRWGVLDDAWITSIDGADTFEQALARAQGADGGRVPLSAVSLLSPVQSDAKIICAGLNYRAHLLEMKRTFPEHPSIFVRFADSLVGHDAPVVRPFNSDCFDYEAELAVVIGKPARHVSVDDALDYVAGYTCMAENSVRDFQQHNTQATPGKNFEHSGALGPWIVTADEIPDPGRLVLIGRLNGQEVQRSGTDDLIFSVPQLIAYLSSFTTLNAGDVIGTGTPEGVGMTRKPPRYLREGDVFEVDVSGIGTLANTVANERRRHVE